MVLTNAQPAAWTRGWGAGIAAGRCLLVQGGRETLVTWYLQVLKDTTVASLG